MAIELSAGLLGSLGLPLQLGLCVHQQKRDIELILAVPATRIFGQVLTSGVGGMVPITTSIDDALTCARIPQS